MPPGASTWGEYDPARPDAVTLPDGTLVFVAEDDEHGAELWRIDGTAGGTRRITDLAPGPAPTGPAYVTVHGGRVYFTASPLGHSSTLYSIAVADLDLPAGEKRVHGTIPVRIEWDSYSFMAHVPVVSTERQRTGHVRSK